MSDSRKYLLGATATIVAARIAARASQKPSAEPALKDEFVTVYKELEQAFDTIGSSSPQKPYSEKRKRENENLLGD